MHAIITWSDNWADEMDIEGFVITNLDEAKEWYESMKNYNENFEICIGTNEEIYYQNGEEFIKTITLRKLSEENFSILNETIGDKFGHTSFYQKFYNR